MSKLSLYGYKLADKFQWIAYNESKRKKDSYKIYLHYFTIQENFAIQQKRMLSNYARVIFRKFNRVRAFDYLYMSFSHVAHIIQENKYFESISDYRNQYD